MLDHFSASQINQFLADQALWILRWGWDVKGEVGPGAWRGSAVEAAFDVALYRPDTPADTGWYSHRWYIPAGSFWHWNSV